MFTNNNNDTLKKTASTAAVNIIGNGTTITGDIKSKGDIRVDGSLNGSVETEGKVVVGQGGVNQLGQVISNQFGQPIRAYVVSGDITSAQELDRNITSTVVLG